MDIRGFYLQTFLFIKFCLSLNDASNVGYFGCLNFPNISSALYKNVQFLSVHIGQVNLDTIFGLTLVEANLAALLSFSNAKLLPEEINAFTDIVKLCARSRVFAKEKFIHEKNPFVLSVMGRLLQPRIWKRPIHWQHGSLGLSMNSNITIRNKAASLIFDGTPREAESDYCLMELVNAVQCRVSNACAQMLLKNDNSRGYPLTHRLLFVLLAKLLACKEHPATNFSKLTEYFCQRILQDLVDLEANGFPSISRDLAMEQISLCGMEGHLEFVTQHYARLILSWQNIHGCYTALNLKKMQMHQRRKKSTNLMDYGCDSHASGVAAAASSILIRGYFENCDSLLDNN